MRRTFRNFNDLSVSDVGLWTICEPKSGGPGRSRWVDFNRESWPGISGACVGWQLMTVDLAAQWLGCHRSWRCRTRTQRRARHPR
jgi:hypothetical protein